MKTLDGKKRLHILITDHKIAVDTYHGDIDRILTAINQKYGQDFSMSDLKRIDSINLELKIGRHTKKHKGIL